VGEFATLVKAVSDLIWALLAVGAIFVFRNEIRSLFGRLRRGRVGDIEIELDQLQQSAETAAKETPANATRETKELSAETALPLPPAPTTAPEAAVTSPKLALVFLAAAIEREVRAFIAATGRAQGRSVLPLHVELERLELPRPLISAVRQFWTVRNRVVHGHAATDDEAVRAVDLGISILATLRSIPREVNVVYHTGVELYKDPGGRQPITDARGIVLETTASDGSTKSLRVFPTTRTHYVKGKQVAWEWNPEKQWGETWYRDPDSGEINAAWRGSMEFVGRHLDEV